MRKQQIILGPADHALCAQPAGKKKTSSC